MIYMIRRLNPHTVQLAKFEDHSEPEDVYELNLTNQYCNCPSPHKPCKHYDLVQQWKKKGGMFVDGKLVKNPVLDTTEIKKLLRKIKAA